MKFKNMLFAYFLVALFISACQPSESSSEEAVETEEVVAEDTQAAKINLPDGFTMTEFAEVENARSMALSPSGTVFIGTRNLGSVFAVKDTDGDGIADEKYTIAEGMNSPNGVAFKDGDLYVAEINRILRYKDIEANLDNPPAFEVIYDKYPTDGHHGWKYIAFGPDGKLYVPVGAPCNICESDEIYASITRINPDGTDMEIVAHGIRNTVGFDWSPTTGELWFTDNGRDMLGDDIPPCELNKITEVGQHFGYPYCHGGTIADPEFGDKRDCSEFEKPMFNFNAHVAPLGMTFYKGDMFPEEYKGDIFVAQHGSWNRSSKIGYRIMRMSVENNEVTKGEVFIDGWLNDANQYVSGRPVDVIELPDGSLLISDDFGGKVYRVTYK